MQGWVDLCYVKADWPGLNLRPVSRKSNALSSEPVNQRMQTERYPSVPIVFVSFFLCCVATAYSRLSVVYTNIVENKYSY